MSFYDKVRRQKFLSLTVMIFTLAIGILIGTFAQTGAKAAKEQVLAPDATPLTIPPAVRLPSEFTKLAQKLEPSVVNISTEYIPKKAAQPQARPNTRRPQQRQQDNGDDGDDNGGLPDLFQRFFGGPGGSGGGDGQFQFGEPEDHPSAALGSGVVVDPNGYILTNNHVVDKATRIRVKFADDDTEYPAKVIGTDTETDLAVIHVDKRGLVAAKIGNSDALEPGDWSVAIGSPFGFQATVTAGIISAVARDIPGEPSSFQHFIQTDAAINPGNSGGPLANINGEVIGINTMIASRSGGYQGIGFAMPINTAVKVYNQIIKTGHVTRGSIGISFSATEDPNHTALLKVYGSDHGVFVQTVMPDEPAEKAGMKQGDVVTAINGHRIDKGQDLIDMVADSPLGSTLKFSILRDKKPMTLDVVVGDRSIVLAENRPGAGSGQSDNSPDATAMKFGMSVQALRQTDRQNMNFKGGVMIASTETGSFAEDIGLQKGDVIVEMNRQPVNSPEDVRRIQTTLKPGDAVAFHIMRQTMNQRGGTGEWQSAFVAGTVPAN